MNQNNNNEHLGSASIGKLFVQYAIPGIIGLLFMGIYTIIDGLFLGRYEGANALASINLVMPFLGLLIAISLVVSVGSQSVMGIKLGEGDEKGMNDAFRTGAIALFLFTIVVSALTFICSEQIAYLLGANDLLADDVIRYIQTLSLFLPLFSGMFYADYTLRISGHPVYAMNVTIGAVILNVILDYIFIVKLSLGVPGAALGTGIAFSIGFILMCWPLFFKQKTIALRKGVFSYKLLGRILYNGSSEGIAELATGITTFVFNIALMRYAGEAGVAAFASINFISFIGIAVLLGMSEGIRPILSYNWGAQNFHRVKKTLKLGYGVAAGIGIVLFLLFLTFSQRLIEVFIAHENSETAIALATVGAKIYAIAFLLNGANIVSSGYFTAIGEAGKSAIISSSRGIVCMLIGISTLPYLFGIEGIWLSIPFAECLTLFLGIWLVRGSFKKMKNARLS
ncbi:MAG: MATE family efflux transporter [Bacilli bacterium]